MFRYLSNLYLWSRKIRTWWGVSLIKKQGSFENKGWCAPGRESLLVAVLVPGQFSRWVATQGQVYFFLYGKEKEGLTESINHPILDHKFAVSQFCLFYNKDIEKHLINLEWMFCPVRALKWMDQRVWKYWQDQVDWYTMKQSWTWEKIDRRNLISRNMRNLRSLRMWQLVL